MEVPNTKITDDNPLNNGELVVYKKFPNRYLYVHQFANNDCRFYETRDDCAYDQNVFARGKTWDILGRHPTDSKCERDRFVGAQNDFYRPCMLDSFVHSACIELFAYC